MNIFKKTLIVSFLFSGSSFARMPVPETMTIESLPFGPTTVPQSPVPVVSPNYHDSPEEGAIGFQAPQSPVPAVPPSHHDSPEEGASGSDLPQLELPGPAVTENTTTYHAHIVGTQSVTASFSENGIPPIFGSLLS